MRDFPISDDAQRYYKSGPPFLQRYMPFWAATLVDRIIVLLVPLLVYLGGSRAALLGVAVKEVIVEVC